MISALFFVSLLTIAAESLPDRQGPEAPVTFRETPKQLHIDIAGKPFATYVFQHDQVLRPFFAHVHTRGGRQVTRNFPPRADKDATDHATMHPGIWLAFGDLSGGDFWRNKGAAQHAGFVEKPKSSPNRGSFVVRNRYVAGGKTLAEETCRIVIHARDKGVLLLLDSTFSHPDGLFFGDQEEMGLGVRVATSMAAKQGGRITNSDGHKNEKQVWGKQADWCDYRGKIGAQQAGIVLMPHPENFRRSWFHARDYGLLVANPFGQSAFSKGPKSKIDIKPGESLRLRFGVFIYDGEIDPAAAYRDYLSCAKPPSER